MTLTQLRYLVAIADAGLNITLAAARDPEEHAADLAPLEQMLGRLTEAIVSALARHGLRFTIDPADAVRALTAIADQSHQQSLVQGQGCSPSFCQRVVALIHELGDVAEEQ